MNINRVFYWCGSKLVKAYTKIMLRMSVVSYLPIPRGPKIIVANHPTTSDPFILTSVSNGQAAVLIKDSLFNVPVFGRYLYWAGHVPVKKNGGGEAFEKALSLLKNGVTIIIFIEGDLSKFIHKIGKPKTGAVRLALLSGVTIITIGIGIKRGNIKTLKSVIKGVQEWGKWYLKGPYAITVGKPIKITGKIENRTLVKGLSKWLSEKILKLQKESNVRINRISF